MLRTTSFRVRKLLCRNSNTHLGGQLRSSFECVVLTQQAQFSGKKDPTEKGSGGLTILKSAISSTVDFVANPRNSWNIIKKEALHYWVGSKLLWSEIKIASALLSRVAKGHSMTRRERMQLLRTATDIFRLVPFAVFIIVPFMELLLPFALKLFPNMLPSTFQDSLKKEESMKKELQMRLAVAGFLQETLKELAAKKNQDNSDASGAKEVIEFIDKARLGEAMPNESVIRIARLFKDELTLANIGRPQLVSMCQYMGLKPYGADAFIRFQLRAKIRDIKEDDRRILWEGIDSLTVDELRDACRERGMRFLGLTHFGYKRQLQDWLDLSIQKNVPLSLLIMSRAFNLTSSTSQAEDVLKSSISSLTDDTINEVVLAAALPGEEHSIEIQQRKLDSLEFQNEMIHEERVESEEARQAKAQQIKQKASTASAVPLVQVSAEISTVVVDSDINCIPKESATTKSSPSPLPFIQAENKIGDRVDEVLTVEDFQTLGDLARGSSVIREKAELAILQANVESVSIADDSSFAKQKLTTSFTDEQPRDVKSEKSIKRIHAVLDTMLDKLKLQIDTTEKALGDKLSLLDTDGDGELTSEELKGAILKILKRASTDGEAQEIVDMLDRDQDGKVSVIELLKYIEERKNKIEVEDLESQVKSAENNRKL